MTPLSSEIRSLAFVGALAVVLLLAFPMYAVGFRAPAVPGDRPSSAAFVTLTPEAERQAVLAARTPWQSDGGSRRSLRVWLSLVDLPEESVVQDSFSPDSEAPWQAEPAFGPADYPMPPWRPSRAADRPTRLAPEAEPKRIPAFSRDELLKLN